MRKVALGLFLCLASVPVFAEAPAEEEEKDAYVPNRFRISARAGGVIFADQQSLAQTGYVGFRVGLDLCKFAAVDIGMDYMKFSIRPEANDSSVDDNLGIGRMFPLIADLRVNVAKIDPWIPWPKCIDWLQPELIFGVGLAYLRVYEASNSALDVSYRSGSLLLHGGGAITIAPWERLSFSLEGGYTWIDQSIHIQETAGNSNFPSTINLDYWSIGASVTFKF